MKKQSGTVIQRGQSDSQPQRHLPLVDILVDTPAELQELVVASGLKGLGPGLVDSRQSSDTTKPSTNHVRPWKAFQALLLDSEASSERALLR